MEPVRCFTCNAVLHFRRYEELVQSPMPVAQAFDAMRVPRFCCRRMYLGHPVELEEHIRSFPLRDKKTADYTLRFEADSPCEVSTE